MKSGKEISHEVYNELLANIFDIRCNNLLSIILIDIVSNISTFILQ